MTQETNNKKALELIDRIKKLGNELTKAKLLHKYEYDIEGDDESDEYDDWWVIFHLHIPEFDIGYVLVSEVVKIYEKILEFFPNCEPELYHWGSEEDFVISSMINGFN